MSASKHSRPVIGKQAERCKCGHMRRYHYERSDMLTICTRCHYKGGNDPTPWYHDFKLKEKTT